MDAEFCRICPLKKKETEKCTQAESTYILYNLKSTCSYLHLYVLCGHSADDRRDGIKMFLWCSVLGLLWFTLHINYWYLYWSVLKILHFRMVLIKDVSRWKFNRFWLKRFCIDGTAFVYSTYMKCARAIILNILI